MPKQSKESSNKSNSDSGIDRQIRRMHVIFVLLFMIANKGIEFVGHYFRKTDNIKTLFFCPIDYKLTDKLNNIAEETKQKIIEKLDLLVTEMQQTTKHSPDEQIKIGQVLVEVCELLGIELEIYTSQKYSNQFPKVKHIPFEKKSFTPLQLFDKFYIEEKLVDLMNSGKFNSNDYIKITSRTNEITTIDQMIHTIQFEKSEGPQPRGPKTVVGANEFEQIQFEESEGPQPRGPKTVIGANEFEQTSTVSLGIIINDKYYDVYLIDEQNCCLVDSLNYCYTYKYFVDQHGNYFVEIL